MNQEKIYERVMFCMTTLTEKVLKVSVAWMRKHSDDYKLDEDALDTIENNPKFKAFVQKRLSTVQTNSWTALQNEEDVLSGYIYTLYLQWSGN